MNASALREVELPGRVRHRLSEMDTMLDPHVRGIPDPASQSATVLIVRGNRGRLQRVLV